MVKTGDFLVRQRKYVAIPTDCGAGTGDIMGSLTKHHYGVKDHGGNLVTMWSFGYKCNKLNTCSN